MPLDFTFIGRAFDENPDPKKLQKILQEIKVLFNQDIEKYLDVVGKIKFVNENEISPTLAIASIIDSIQVILKEMGWPEIYKEMLDEFIRGLYKQVGIL